MSWIEILTVAALLIGIVDAFLTMAVMHRQTTDEKLIEVDHKMLADEIVRRQKAVTPPRDWDEWMP